MQCIERAMDELVEALDLQRAAQGPQRAMNEKEAIAVVTGTGPEEQWDIRE
jgi:hypothetical protein